MAKTRKKATIRRPGSVGTLTKKKPPKQRAKIELPEKTMTPCYFCKKEVDEGEFRCQGCGEVVCDDCDELSPWGRHDPFEHTAEGSEED